MKRGTVKRAMNRTDEISENIFNLLKKSDKPLSTQEIADNISRPWHSVQNRCLRLQIEGKINGFRAGRINLWQYKEVK